MVHALILCCTSPSWASSPPVQPVRSFQLSVEVTVPRAEGDAPIELFLPVPSSGPHQTLSGLELSGPVSGEFATESAFGNRYWHATIPAASTPARFAMTLTVERSAFRVDLGTAEARALSAGEREQHAQALAATPLVPVGDDVESLAPLLAEVRAARTNAEPASTARAIYDWVSTHMEYKKVGTGWGNGDTFWACSNKYGNCTDFHSVFLSLARTEGIPASFEMGFPVPTDRKSGEIAGYHCWVRFWLPGVGWVPLDASEAAKHPERREALYGGLPADRVRFSRGRDLRLGPAHKGKALNYFIYPYAERDGAAWDGPITRRITYADE